MLFTAIIAHYFDLEVFHLQKFSLHVINDVLNSVLFVRHGLTSQFVSLKISVSYVIVQETHPWFGEFIFEFRSFSISRRLVEHRFHFMKVCYCSLFFLHSCTRVGILKVMLSYTISRLTLRLFRSMSECFSLFLHVSDWHFLRFLSCCSKITGFLSLNSEKSFFSLACPPHHSSPY